MTNLSTKILLVDDNKVKLLTEQKIIKKRLSIDCHIAQSGLDAIEEFKNNHYYNIIILDMLMPEMDGFEVATKIKDYCTKKDIKLPHIISYTVLEGNEVQERAVECGISDYIAAGNVEELIKVVEKWIMFDNDDFFIC